MTIQRVDELTTEPVVGKYYLVPCISYAGQYVPVVGDIHNDFDVIGFAADHIHYDFRFLTQNQIDLVSSNYDGKPSPAEIEDLLVMVYTQYWDEGKPDIKIRKKLCKRSTPIYPKQFFSARLDKAYRNTSICAGKCPHRGIDLRAEPARNGVVVCPGHGTCWDAKSGNNISRTVAFRRMEATQ